MAAKNAEQMTNSVSPDISKRLLYVKYLLSRAKPANADRNDLSVAVSLLLIHDAIEMLMLAVVEHLQVPMPKKWDFMDFWTEIGKHHTEPPQRILMDALNNMRVGLKHKGNLPNPHRVRDLLPRIEVFCEDVAKMYIQIDLAELSLADLVADDEVRNTLRKARQAFLPGDKNDAFVNVRIAFDKLLRQSSSDTSLIREPRTREALQNTVLESVRILNILMLGIDDARYRFFVANTPQTVWTISGKCQVNIQRDYNRVLDAVFETCFEFVVDVALNASR